MCGDGQLAQLAHVAEDGDAAGTRRAREQAQRLGHGLRVGVVAVVDNQAALRTADEVHARAGRNIGRDAAHDLLRRQAEIFADGGGHRRGIDHVRAGGGNLERIGRLRRPDGAGQPLEPAVGDVRHAHVAIFTLAAADDALGEGDGMQQLVVAV